MCIGVGVWALRRTTSTRDFFMAGRDLGIFVTGLAVFSSTMSGFGFVGGPGLVYRMGMSSSWMTLTSVLGFCVTFYLLGKRLRMIAELRDTISLPDAVAARYGSELTRLLTAVAILLGVLGYLGTQILAMATVLRDVLASVSFIPEISIVACVAIACAVLVFYCVTGGILASVYTDLVQGAIMIVAALFVFAATLSAVDGGLAGIAGTLMADDPEAISPWGTLGMMGALSWFFLFAIGGSGQPHVITKLMMNRRIDDARRILPVSAGGYLLCSLLWVSIGLAVRALVLQGAQPELASPDEAAPRFLQLYASPVLAGVVFAALFAAIMSTADSFLNLGAAAVVHDIPRALRGRSLRRELLSARVATVVIAVGSALFALYSRQDLVALLGAFGWGTFAAALVPTVTIGFNWKRATATAANVAIVTSLAVNFGIEIFDVAVPWGMDGGAIALLLSLTLFFGISLASRPPVIDPDIDAVMDL
ncbi:MAG: sodium/proline symporter, partial [Acidobacteria bacterium]|nr:sodium/proline symporter [Acidobacteriota bacterium]